MLGLGPEHSGGDKFLALSTLEGFSLRALQEPPPPTRGQTLTRSLTPNGGPKGKVNLIGTPCELIHWPGRGVGTRNPLPLETACVCAFPPGPRRVSRARMACIEGRRGVDATCQRPEVTLHLPKTSHSVAVSPKTIWRGPSPFLFSYTGISFRGVTL